MTYCLAITVNQGLVLMSDSRTNAGVDRLSTYSKMFRFEEAGERVFTLLTAGNLATSQAVSNRIKRDIKAGNTPNLNTVEHLTDAAEYVGQVSCEQQQKHMTAAADGGVDTSASFILAGQIGAANPRIFMIYPEGNYISATDENPYQQIGEIKYGKPILDRILTPDTPLDEAALCALVSMDSTMRSNATVGPPVEMLIYTRDSLHLDRHFTFQADHPFLLSLNSSWDQALKQAFDGLPRFNGLRENDPPS